MVRILIDTSTGLEVRQRKSGARSLASASASLIPKCFYLHLGSRSDFWHYFHLVVVVVVDAKTVVLDWAFTVAIFISRVILSLQRCQLL